MTARPAVGPRQLAASIGAMIGPMADHDDLTILGSTVRGPVDHVETFPAPLGVHDRPLPTDELMSRCPVTGQPDLASVVIEYEPAERCVESKSLKLYLWRFRDRARRSPRRSRRRSPARSSHSARPRRVTVTLTQRPRGGITVEAVATWPTPLPPAERRSRPSA